MSRILGWHLELTRRCSLKCPACPRTYKADQIANLSQDLNFSELQSFFKKEELKKIKFLFFQGNLGEPILHPEFHKISEYFFDVQHLSVITNGIQTQQFWTQVLSTWPENSLITFSIDGLQDTNSIYRVGAPWSKIQNLFEIISQTKRKCKIEWKYLVFEHNKHQIEKASKLAKKLGIDSFRIQQSRSLDKITSLGGKIKEVKFNEFDPHITSDEVSKKIIIPFCKTLDLHYIDANGHYYPCCWWSGHYEENNKHNDNWDSPHISEMNIDQAYFLFNKFTQVFDDADQAPSVCQKNCSKTHANLSPLKTPNSQVNRKFLSSKKPTWE